MKRYDQIDLSNAATYAADPELHALAVFTAGASFVSGGPMGRRDWREAFCSGKFPDEMKIAVDAAVEKTLAAESALAAALSVVATITPPTGYSISVEEKTLVLSGAFSEDLHARIKRAGGVWDGKNGGNRRVWLIPAEKAATLKRIFGNSAKAAEKAAAERKVAEKARAEQRAAEEKIKEQQAAAREAQWEAERKARAAAPKKLRALFPCSALPDMERTVRYGGQVVVFTGTGQAFRISEDAPSMHGDHLLGHEGDRGCYCYYRLATDAEIAELVAAETAEQNRAAAEQQRLAELELIRKQIMVAGETPKIGAMPSGKKITLDPATIYGNGEWFVIADHEIWFVLANGMDGDDWDRNNLPGAIGWRIPYTDELAKKLEGYARAQT